MIGNGLRFSENTLVLSSDAMPPYAVNDSALSCVSDKNKVSETKMLALLELCYGAQVPGRCKLKDTVLKHANPEVVLKGNAKELLCLIFTNFI